MAHMKYCRGWCDKYIPFSGEDIVQSANWNLSQRGSHLRNHPNLPKGIYCIESSSKTRLRKKWFFWILISNIFILTHWNEPLFFWLFLCINIKEIKLVYIQCKYWSMHVVICWCSWKTGVQSKSILHDSSSFLSTTDFLIKFLLHKDFYFFVIFKRFYCIKFMHASFSSVQIYKRYITCRVCVVVNSEV